MVFPSEATLKLHKSEQLWDLNAKILTELSRRDNVEYRIKATEESVQKKLLSL